MLIDHSYFTKGVRHIQNASMGTLPNPNAVEVAEAINAYIETYQEQFLTRMLGATVGNKVNAYLVCKDEGDDINKDNIEAVCSQLREPFADYVFYQILRNINSQATMTGLVQLKCANNYVSPIQRQVSIWNSMVDRNRLFVKWSKSSDCKLHNISVSNAMIAKINSLNL